MRDCALAWQPTRLASRGPQSKPLAFGMRDPVRIGAPTSTSCRAVTSTLTTRAFPCMQSVTHVNWNRVRHCIARAHHDASGAPSRTQERTECDVAELPFIQVVSGTRHHHRGNSIEGSLQDEALSKAVNDRVVRCIHWKARLLLRRALESGRVLCCNSARQRPVLC